MHFRYVSFAAVASLLICNGATAQTSKPVSTAKNTPPARTSAPSVSKPAVVPATKPVVAAPVQPTLPDVVRANFIREMDADFRKRDANGDGMATRAEVEQFERNAAIMQAQSNNRALFARLDVDRNGALSPGEFSALVKDPGTPDVGMIMQRFDTNRDQNISMIEYRAATLANFDRLDADKDGVVTDAEVKAGSTKPVMQGR